MSEWTGLPESVRTWTGPLPEGTVELRLRAGQRPEIRTANESRFAPPVLSARQVRAAVDEMARHSLYAWEEELKEGFFTMENGSRVGLGGRFVVREGQISGISHISSAAVRVARAIPGCAQALRPHLCAGAEAVSALILSAPGLGKTTLLRDLARSLSRGEEGWPACRVGLADERCELAACRDGVPTLDVGPRTDVYEACPKRLAIPRMVRALSCDVIVTDELGQASDAECVLDALRCGVRVIASAHARCLEEALSRPALRELLAARAFDAVIELGGRIGQIRRVIRP